MRAREIDCIDHKKIDADCARDATSMILRTPPSGGRARSRPFGVGVPATIKYVLEARDVKTGAVVKTGDAPSWKCAAATG